jgi:translation elongation factor EF-Ts
VLVDQTYVLDDAGHSVQKVIDAERKRLGLDAIAVEGFLRYAVGEASGAGAGKAAA